MLGATCAIAPTSPQANSIPPPPSNLSSPIAEEAEDTDDLAAEVGAGFTYPTVPPLTEADAKGRKVLVKRAKYPTANFKDPTALGWVYTVAEVKVGGKGKKGKGTAARYRLGPPDFNMWFYFSDTADLVPVS